MLIESKLRRVNGTHVEMPSGITYKFEPTADDPRHVAEVEHEDDLARFLKISEGYRIARKDDAKKLVAPGTTIAPVPVPDSSATEAPVIDMSFPTTAPAQPDDLDGMTKSELIDHAKANNIVVNDKLPKPAVIQQIRTARAAT